MNTNTELQQDLDRMIRHYNEPTNGMNKSWLSEQIKIVKELLNKP